MHKQAWDWLAKQAGTLPKTGKALDVGGRNINGNPRELFPGYEWTVVDQIAGPGVDIVGDFPSDEVDDFIDQSGYDLIICTEVLEHVPDNMQCVFFSELLSYVRSDGALLLTAATHPRAKHNCDGTRYNGVEPYCNVRPSVVDCFGFGPFFKSQLIEIDREHGDIYGRYER